MVIREEFPMVFKWSFHKY